MQLRDTLSSPLPTAVKPKGTQRGSRGGRGDAGSDSDETLSNGSNPNDVVPKEEGILLNPFQAVARRLWAYIPVLFTQFSTIFLLRSRSILHFHLSLCPSLVIDHGIASVELVMEEALQDIPTIVYDIQERLKRLSQSVAVDGKPRPGLPNRRLLWDVLKPQASTVRLMMYNNIVILMSS